MIDNVIFSCNRAMQLHLLLESLSTNTNGMFNTVVSYKADPKHAESYDKLINRFRYVNGLSFLKEKTFPSDVIIIVRHFSNPFMCFMTDDSVIYRNIENTECNIYRTMSPGVACFSLRLGLNTTQQWTHTTQPPPKNVVELFSGCISWHFHECDPNVNYGYPMSIDGHIFRGWILREFLNKLYEEGCMSGPNQLEGNLCRFRNQIPPRMASFRTSALVTMPVNKVQTVVSNAYGEVHPAHQDVLLERYMNGEVIDLSKLDFSNIKGCHQELEFKYRKF